MADLLAQRLAPLSPQARELAALLAVLGRPAEDALLEALWPDTEARLAAQAELLERWVLVERGARLRFDHHWLCETLLASLDDVARAQLHARLAAALALAGGRYGPMGHLLALAERAIGSLEAGPRDELRWSQLDLRERHDAATDRGAAWLARIDALAALADTAVRDDWRVEALTCRGRALQELGRYGEAEAVLREAVALAGASGLAAAEALARRRWPTSWTAPAPTPPRWARARLRFRPPPAAASTPSISTPRSCSGTWRCAWSASPTLMRD